jgi:hypothetical protein
MCKRRREKDDPPRDSEACLSETNIGPSNEEEILNLPRSKHGKYWLLQLANLSQEKGY